MQQSNKYKLTVRCGCQACRHYSKFKQDALRNSNRQSRHLAKQLLDSCDFSELDECDEPEIPIISAGYTD